jgi:hypothetical protein
MERSQCGVDMAWHVAALPLPVHAAITGDAMEQSRAKTVAMDRNRLMCTNCNITDLKSPNNAVSAHKSLILLIVQSLKRLIRTTCY